MSQTFQDIFYLDLLTARFEICFAERGVYISIQLLWAKCVYVKKLRVGNEGAGA